MGQDYYEILGVPRDAASDDIKRAFRQIARECHPDVAGADQDAEERFKTARKAYETLMDPVTRARYDRRGQRRAHTGGSFFDAFYRHTGEAAKQAQGAAPNGAGTGPRRSYGNSDAGGARGHRRRDPGNDLGLDDLFNDFGFGAGRSRSTGPQAAPEPAPEFRPQPGGDVSIDLEVPARIARDGGSVTAVYYRMQRADAWRPGNVDRGLIRVQDIADVRVIPGTRDGAVLRERGLGDAGPWGGAHGDLLVRVRVVGAAPTPEPPRREAPEPQAPGEMTVDISVVEAMLGGRIEIGTPQGRVRVTVPPGTSSGARLRLKGRGAPDPTGSPTDLYVVLRIVVPRALDEESRQLVERFAALNPGSPREG